MIAIKTLVYKTDQEDVGDHFVLVVVFDDGTRWYTDASNQVAIKDGKVYGYHGDFDLEDLPDYEDYEDWKEKAVTETTIPEEEVEQGSDEAKEILRIYDKHM